MDIQNLSLFVAFTAGLVSFLSPCVLPLVPSYLAYLAGATPPYELHRRQMFFAALCFTFGFGFVFSVLGVLLNSVLQFVAYDVQLWMSRAGGAMMMFFGLYVMGVFSIGFLERQSVIRFTPFGSRYLTSFLFGASFAAGWTPCVGVVLGAVLGLAATNPGSSFILLFVYAIGLALPFLVAGVFGDTIIRFANQYGWISRPVTMFFGVILVVIGVLIFTQTLGAVSSLDGIFNYFLRAVPTTLE